MLGTAIAITFARSPMVLAQIAWDLAVWNTWQTKAPLRFHGKFYQIDLMTPFFDPGPIEHPHIPIYLAGVNPYMARLAGEVRTGCTSTPSTRPGTSAKSSIRR